MKPPARIPLAALLLAALALLLAACGSNDSDNSSDAAADGSSGEKLTIYSGREEELVAPVYEDFDGEIEVRYGDSAPLAATIIEEGGNPELLSLGGSAKAPGASTSPPSMWPSARPWAG